MADSLKFKIENDLKEAMRAKEDSRVKTLRMLLAALHNREIEKRGRGAEGKLTEEEILEVIRRETKKRKEAIELFTKGNRPELAGKEAEELETLKNYLPQELSEAEVVRIIDEVFSEVKPQSDKDFGKVMAEIMKLTKGKADARRIGEIVKQRMAAS
jgi:hypothetical protein